MKFTRAIVRPPGPSMVRGLTSAHLGPPRYETALAQHDAYVHALMACGLDVIVLDADNDYPDSTFLEDTALLIRNCAIILRPGAPSRRGETESVQPVLRDLFASVERVEPPGTAEGGDIMMVGNHFFIGLSQRTNPDGACQVIEILKEHGLTGSTVPLRDVLHLKSAVAYLENDNLVLAGELLERAEFAGYRSIRVDAEEQYAANCLWLNGTVLVATGFPRTKQAIEACGCRTTPLDVSEFRKLDGGLSCLSLRF